MQNYSLISTCKSQFFRKSRLSGKKKPSPCVTLLYYVYYTRRKKNTRLEIFLKMW